MIIISFSVTASIGDLKLLGVQQGEIIPSLFNSESSTSDNNLFSVSYEKNPLDKLCGDRVIVKSASVHIVYDAQTIIELINLFKVQDPTTLNQFVYFLINNLDSYFFQFIVKFCILFLFKMFHLILDFKQPLLSDWLA